MGAIEEAETPEQTVLREIKEETGLEVYIMIKLGDYYRPNKIFKGKKGDHTQVFLCKYLRGEFIKNEEMSEIRWYHINELPKNIPPWHTQRIEDAVNFKGISFKRIQYF